MVLSDRRNDIEVIERRECLALLADAVMGRLAVLEGGAPLILPVNFTLLDEHVVLRTGAGSKLDAGHGSPACFEIDGFDAEHRSGWSVVVRGHLHEVDRYDQAELVRLQGLADPWVGEREHVLELRPWSVTGRRLRGTS